MPKKISKKRKSKTYWINKLDKLVSSTVRDRGSCEMCGKSGGNTQLQAAHIITRSNKRLRWDLKNLLCLCAGCHWLWHKEPLQSMRWFEGVYKDRADYLLTAKNEISKPRNYEAQYLEFSKQTNRLSREI